MKNLIGTIVAFSFWFYFQVGLQSLPKVLDAFVRDISTNNVSNKKIIDQHICLDSNKRRSKGMEQLIDSQLKELRQMILSKKDEKTMLVKRYSELPHEEKVLLTDKKDEKNIYKVNVNKAHFFLLIEKEKVLAFATMNKGGRRVFQRICDY